jgi:hypothetical protein
MAGEAVQRQSVESHLNLLIQVVQCPIVNTHMKTVRSSFMASLDRTILRQHLHHALKHEFISQLNQNHPGFCLFQHPGGGRTRYPGYLGMRRISGAMQRSCFLVESAQKIDSMW